MDDLDKTFLKSCVVKRKKSFKDYKDGSSLCLK